MKTVKARKVRGLQKQYVLNEPIGKGGMAVVYSAVPLGGGGEVAIKMINPQLTADSAGERFSQEMRMMVQLDHPNIIQVRDIITEPSPGIVMEKMKGTDLHSYLLRIKRANPEQSARVAAAIADGLEYAHNRAIVHRDIKPQNILFADPTLQYPKICDFGVARFMDRESDLTQTGRTVGTLSYMSPEQVMGSKQIDARADIYSLGVTLFAMLTGELPFGGSELELMRAHVSKKPMDPRDLRPEVSDALAQIVLKSLSKDPGARFQTAGRMARLLRAAAGDGDPFVTHSNFDPTIAEREPEILHDAPTLVDDQMKTRELTTRPVKTDEDS